MPKSYDAIIIGTGQSGPALAERLDRKGMKVAVVGNSCPPFSRT